MSGASLESWGMAALFYIFLFLVLWCFCGVPKQHKPLAPADNIAVYLAIREAAEAKWKAEHRMHWETS